MRYFSHQRLCNLSGPLLCAVICLFLSVIEMQLPGCQMQIVVRTRGKFLKWEGCLFRKVIISEKNDTQCHQCTIDPRRPSIPMSRTDWPQEFINCTEFCEYATICTKMLYYSTTDDPPVERPLCYQCENKKDEVIWFESKPHHELCPPDCRRCAELVDLSDAVKCAPICKGYPTFCFPPTLSVLGQKLCYQASDWYGCDYLPVSAFITGAESGNNINEGGELTEKCQECAKEAKTQENARFCRHACSWYPTYYNGTSFLQCRPHATLEDKNNNLFLYNVPDEIMEFIQMSNASFLYSVDISDSNVLKYMDGIIAKQIFQKFDMARMNSPLPVSRRMFRDDQTNNDFIFLPLNDHK